jgi:hypothetical protein
LTIPEFNRQEINVSDDGIVLDSTGYCPHPYWYTGGAACTVCADEEVARVKEHPAYKAIQKERNAARADLAALRAQQAPEPAATPRYRPPKPTAAQRIVRAVTGR